MGTKTVTSMQQAANTTAGAIATTAKKAGRAIPKKGAAYSIELPKQPIIYLSKSTDSLTSLGRKKGGFASFGGGPSTPSGNTNNNNNGARSPSQRNFNWSRPPAESSSSKSTSGGFVGLVIKGKSSGTRRRSIRPLADSVSSSITGSTCSSVRSSITLSEFGDITDTQDDDDDSWKPSNNFGALLSSAGPPALAREVSNGSDSLPLRPLRRVSDCRWNNSSSHHAVGSSLRSSTSSVTLSMVESIAEEEDDDCYDCDGCENCETSESEEEDDGSMYHEQEHQSHHHQDNDHGHHDHNHHHHHHHHDCQESHSHDDHCISRSYKKNAKKSYVLGLAASGVVSAANFATTAANVGLATTQKAAIMVGKTALDTTVEAGKLAANTTQKATIMVGKTALDTTVGAGKLAANTTQRAAGATIMVGKTALDTTVEAGKLAANTTQAAALGAGKLAANATKTALDTTGAAASAAGKGCRRLSAEANILGSTKRSSLRNMLAGTKLSSSGSSSHDLVEVNNNHHNNHKNFQYESSSSKEEPRPGMPRKKSDLLPSPPGRRESIFVSGARRLSVEASNLGKKRGSLKDLVLKTTKTAAPSSSHSLVSEKSEIYKKEQPSKDPTPQKMNDSLPSLPGRRESIESSKESIESSSCAEASSGDLLPRKPGRKASLDNTSCVMARQA